MATSHSESSPSPIPAQSPSAPLEVPRTILFVEGDPAIREQLSTCLEGLATSFRTRIATSGGEALSLLSANSFDGIAPAAALSDMAGLELIQKAVELHPEITGFLQSTPEQRSEIIKQPGLPPHFLPHPPNPTELADGLTRAFQLSRWMTGPKIRALLVRMENLPAVPSLYARVMRELRSDDPSIEAVGKLISQDPALTAKMLQMVNSPVFALGRPLSEAVDAVTFLGAERTKALILMASLSLHGSLTPCEGFSQESFWQHSLSVATMARTLALKELKNASVADSCFTAGLLHDIGKLLFASNLPREYGAVTQAAKEKQIPLHEAEIAEFGSSHGQLGASLLGTWGLPVPVLEAIAWHEHPNTSQAPGYSGVTIIHVANVLEYEKRGCTDESLCPKFELDYLTALGLADRLNHWRSLCGCPPRQEAAKAA